MVNAPKGVVMPSIKKAMPAITKGVGPMATAMHHHAMLGAALKSGNITKARHHVGHVFMALKGEPSGAPKVTSDQIPAASTPAPVESMSDGTAEGSGGSSAPSPTMAPAGPTGASGSQSSMSKPGVSAMFSKLRGGK